MADIRKKLYGRVVKLDRIIKAMPGLAKTLVVLMVGGIAGEEHCKGRELIGFAVLGVGLLVSLGGLCRGNSKKG